MQKRPGKAGELREIAEAAGTSTDPVVKALIQQAEAEAARGGFFIEFPKNPPGSYTETEPLVWRGLVKQGFRCVHDNDRLVVRLEW